TGKGEYHGPLEGIQKTLTAIHEGVRDIIEMLPGHGLSQEEKFKRASGGEVGFARRELNDLRLRQRNDALEIARKGGYGALSAAGALGGGASFFAGGGTAPAGIGGTTISRVEPSGQISCTAMGRCLPASAASSSSMFMAALPLPLPERR